MIIRIIGLSLCVQVIACTVHHHHQTANEPKTTKGAEPKCDPTGKWFFDNEVWTLDNDQNGKLRVMDAAENEDISATSEFVDGSCRVVIEVLRDEVPGGSGDFILNRYELTVSAGNVYGVNHSCDFGNNWDEDMIITKCPEERLSSYPVSGRKETLAE